MKTINQTLLAGAIAAVLAAPAFATNGTNMTGVGAQSVAMGGGAVADYRMLERFLRGCEVSGERGASVALLSDADNLFFGAVACHHPHP